MTRRVKMECGCKLPISMRIELVDLETFIAVAQRGSFSLAAVDLRVTQPSVTSRIQRLEAALGTKLLVRTTRSVQLTPQGQQLLDRAEVTLRDLRALVETMRQQAGVATKRVIVATTPMLASTTLPPIIRAYCDQNPGVDVQLRDSRATRALETLLSGQADLGVLAFGGDDKKFRFQPLREEEMVVVVPSNHVLARHKRASIDQIAAHPLMMLEQYEHMRRQISEEIGGRGLTLQPAMSAGNLTTLLGMLESRMGITLLPRFMASRSEKAGHVVVEMTGIELSRTFGIVLVRGTKQTVVTQRFCRFLRDALTSPVQAT